MYVGLGFALPVGTASAVGAETAPWKPPVFTLNGGESIARIVTASGREPQHGCFAPEQFILQPVPGELVGGVGTAWNIGDAALLALRDSTGGRVRYGIPLYDGTVEALPEDGTGELLPVEGGSLTVTDASSNLPLARADLLLRAGDGHLCRLQTDEQGVAALPETVSSVGVIVAADGFAGGLLPLPADRHVRLPRTRSIAIHLSTPAGGDVTDLAVLVLPEQRVRGSHDVPLAIAGAHGDRVVQLRGIPAWRGRVLVAAFRDGVPAGMSDLRADAGDAVSVHIGSGAVTAKLPVQDLSPAIDTVRIERFYGGGDLADFALGPLARRLDFRLHRTSSGLSREDLPAYAWYSVVGAEDGPHFYLDAGELKNLGDLKAPNLLSLVVAGPESAQGWATYACWNSQLGSTLQGRTLTTGSGRFPLWLPGACQSVDGQLTVPDWPVVSFRWNDSEDRQIRIRMRRAGAIRGWVRGPKGSRLANVALSATWQYPVELEEADDEAEIGPLIEKYPIFLDREQSHAGPFTYLEPRASTRTGATGRFVLYVPFNGEYVVEATHDGHYAPTVTVALDSGPVEIEMREAASLVGEVRNARGQPVEAGLHWTQVGQDTEHEPSAWTHTDEDGAFSFPALPPGRTEVTVSVPGGEPERVEYDLESGPNEVEIRLENPLVRIEGVVVGPSDDIVDDVERVEARPPYYCPSGGPSAKVGADGRFFFENVSPGVVKLFAETESHASGTVELMIEPTDTVRQVKLDLLGKSGRITGRIESSVSLANARITAYTGLHYASAPISASGEFDLPDLAVGTWSLGIDNWGLTHGQDAYTEVAAVEISHEGSFRYVEVDLTTLPTLTLVGGPPGERVNGAGSVKLDANGSGVLRVPRAGAYELVWKVGHYFFFKKVTVEGDTTFSLADPPDRREPVPRFQC